MRKAQTAAPQLKPIEHSEGGGFVTRFYLMHIGRHLGGKCGSVIACPSCGKPAWKKSEREYVHESTTQLGKNNEPETYIANGDSCKLAKSVADALAHKTARAGKK